MQNKRKIGILGGTFNPIHNGHIALAKEAFSQYNLDEVWVMVSGMPPHKKNDNIADSSSRMDMVKLATQNYPYMIASDFELQREGFIYTADTLTLLCEQYPQNEYYFIVGGDSLASFERWYHPEIILQKAILLAACRDDVSAQELEHCISILTQKYEGKIYPLKLDDIPFSSTQIREAIALEKDVSYMIDTKVLNYILEKQLYNNN